MVSWSGDKSVVLTLQSVDYSLNFFVPGYVLVNLFPNARRGLTQCNQGQLQIGNVGNVFEQSFCGAGVVRLREVVGDMHRKAHRLVPVLRHTKLEQ